MAALTTLTLIMAASLGLTGKDAAVLPLASELEVRLLHAIGSRASHVGDPVEASVVSPIYKGAHLLVGAGATVSGTVQHRDRLGLGLRHATARLDLHFTQLRLADGHTVPIDAVVSSIETAREIVRTDGAVIGINPTANFSTGVAAVFTLAYLGERELLLPILGFKFLAARSPDAEIELPAGTDMVLRLVQSVQIENPAGQESEVPLLGASEITSAENILTGLPAQRTNHTGKRPSDLVNILILGSEDEVNRSFRAAGWSGAERHGVLALYRMFHCAVERKGYRMAPMANLELNGKAPDASFQKSLDTFAKRHHIRLWRDAQSGAWLGAATEDVSYKFRGHGLTHATDPHIDNERAKVVNDLAFTGCLERGAQIPRSALEPAQEYGRPIVTDGDIAVLQLNACNSPRITSSDPQKPRPVRFVRGVFVVAEDIARSNPISLAYAVTKSLLDRSSVRANERMEAARVFTRPSAVASASATSGDGVLAER